MTVMLDQPLRIEGSEDGPGTAGYMIVIGINAPDLAVAGKYAHDGALRPKQSDGTFRSFVGVVTEAHIARIDVIDLDPKIRKHAKRIDQEGIYYSSGLIFFPVEPEGRAEPGAAADRGNSDGLPGL